MELRTSSLYTAIAMLLLGAVTVLVLLYWRMAQPPHPQAHLPATHTQSQAQAQDPLQGQTPQSALAPAAARAGTPNTAPEGTAGRAAGPPNTAHAAGRAPSRRASTAPGPDVQTGPRRSPQASPQAGRKTAPQAAGVAGAIYPLAGSREPSGALSLPGKGIILVVDDEPKAAPGQLGLFAYRVQGQRLQHLPLRLRYPQKRRWDDWEGIASDGRYVVLMASHGKRKGKRARICRFPIASLQVQAQQVVVAASLDCVGGKRQRKKIKKLIKRARSGLQFGLPSGWRYLDPKQGGLDIEAIVYAPQEGVYFLGLRGPLAIRGEKSLAIVLEMQWGQGDPVFGVAGLLDLQARGVRAFTRLADGRVLISAGPMGSQGTFGLYQLKRWPARPFLTHTPRALRYTLPTRGPRLQIEGLAAWRQWLFLFSDSGDWMAGKDAHYLVLPLKKVLRP